jgi:hypothetical protein
MLRRRGLGAPFRGWPLPAVGVQSFGVRSPTCGRSGAARVRAQMTAIGRRTAQTAEARRRRVGRKGAQKAQESDGTAEGWPQRSAKSAKIGWDGENQTTDNEGRRRVGRRRTDGAGCGRRRVGRKEAQKAQESDGTAEGGRQRADD